MKKNSKEEQIKSIVIERLRHMSSNFKVAIGSSGEFLHRDEIISEVSKNTDVGNKILKIQRLYIESLKKKANA